MPSSISESITEAVASAPSSRLRAKEASRRGTKPTPCAPRSIKISCFFTDKTVPETTSPVAAFLIESPALASNSSIVTFLASAILIFFLPSGPFS